MYKFKSALLRKKGVNEKFLPVDLTAVRMSSLFNDYLDGYIEFTHPSLSNIVYVQLQKLRSQALPFTDVPFQSWLASIGNQTIFGETKKPELVEATITYADAIQAGFAVRRSHPRDPMGTAGVYPQEDMRDAFITKSLSDSTLLHRRVLTTVNGLLHINIPSSTGLLVVEAGRSLDIEGDNHIGVMSFENIADIKQVVIKPEMILTPPTDRSLRDAVYLNCGENIKNKTVMLSFMGRLYVADKVVQKISDEGALRINTYLLDMTQLIMTSRTKIDLSSLELDEREYMKKAVKLDDVIDNDVITKMLLLRQSFLIIVDTPLLTVTTETLNSTQLAGVFESQRPIHLPYIDSSKIMYPAWKMLHPGAYVDIHRWHFKDTFYRSPVMRTGDQYDQEWVNPIEEITNVDFEIGKLLDITAQEIRYGG